MPRLPVSRVRAGAAALAALALAGCAHAVPAAVAPHAPGFLLGLFHGWVVLFSFIGSLFDPTIAIYAVPNNGGWYDFGFALGAGAFGGGGAAAVRRRR
ncbi:hypothetical protein ACFO0A_03595 [Novosphingobium tardum]|uniref:Lipoprotein n=1 Tax=Novosphingobium tardum TaxID=1538021 RepID=A0ABV8RMV2_9SPHN